jgi:prohibitin 2
LVDLVVGVRLPMSCFCVNSVFHPVSITNLTFSKEYTAAVEAKQVVQQEAERSKFIVSAAVFECMHSCWTFHRFFWWSCGL